METEIKHDFNLSKQVTGGETAADGSICLVCSWGLEVTTNFGDPKATAIMLQETTNITTLEKNHVPFASIV